MSKYHFNIIQGVLEYRGWCFLYPGSWFNMNLLPSPAWQLAVTTDKVLEGLLCKPARWPWWEARLLKVLSAVLAPTSTTTSTPGRWRYPCSIASTAGSSQTGGFSPWPCHQPHTSNSVTPRAPSRGLLLLVFREDLPLRRGSMVLSTTTIWQMYRKGEINQLGIPGWKSCDGWMSCTLTINTRCTTRLHWNSQSSLTAP